MKILVLLLVAALFITACSKEQDRESAKQYLLELQYYEHSAKFSGLNMNDEAPLSCQRTTLLRSECFTSFVQDLLSKNIAPKKEHCDEIKPEYRMKMSMQAFRYVYPEIDETLEQELKEKIRPSKKRMEMLQKIKDDCYQAAQK